MRGGGRPISLIAAGAGLVALVGATPAANAYVRRLTDGGIPEYWQKSCVPITVYLNGFSMMTRDEVAKSVAAAAHIWGPDAVTCADGSHPYLEIDIAVDPDPNATAVVADDARNSLIIETRSWPHEPDALSITSAFAKDDGRILDADIQLNAVPSPAGRGYEWANIDPGAPAGKYPSSYDLQVVLTHELGHFLGLAHTCYNDDVNVPWPNDDMGNPVPSCGSAPIAVQETVMWFQSDIDNTVKRVLTADDVRGVCAIYPAAQDPHSCALDAVDDGCGCSAAASPRSGVGVLGTLAALALSRRRSRCGRRAPRPRRA
jgi:hypothetical protein